MAREIPLLTGETLTPGVVATMEPEQVGLLPYEMSYVRYVYDRAVIQKQTDIDAFAEAAANSGGDWALDDPATHAAAEAGHINDLIRSELGGIRSLDEIPYPEPDYPFVTFGSRVTLREGEYTDVYDLPTHFIHSLRPAEGIEFLSPYGLLGRSILLREVGQEVTWEPPTGNIHRATILELDQVAQRTYFDGIVASLLTQSHD